MSYNILNKFEKEKRVIELHIEGKTIRDIAEEVHMSFRDISKIIKSYDKKMEIEAKQKENHENNNNNRNKEISLSTRACKLFLANKKPIQVKIELNISSALAEKFWLQYLKLNKLNEFYEFYEIFQYDMPNFLAISGFIRKNNIEIEDIGNILRNANDISALNKLYLKRQNEITQLEQRKNSLQYYYQNNQYYPFQIY